MTARRGLVACADGRRRVDAGEQGARLVFLEDGGLAGVLAVARLAHGVGGVALEHVAGARWNPNSRRGQVLVLSPTSTRWSPS